MVWAALLVGCAAWHATRVPASDAALQAGEEAHIGEHISFLEIGLSDFNTAAQLTNDTGLSVDAVPTYVERIPARPGLRKLAAAISNETGGTVDVYYLSLIHI